MGVKATSIIIRKIPSKHNTPVLTFLDVTSTIISKEIPLGGIEKGAILMLNDAEIENLSRRLRRIRGQVEGIEAMIEDHRYCVDVLHQIGAMRAALYRVGVLLLESHSRSCVVDAIKHGDEEQAITELMGVYKALHK